MDKNRKALTPVNNGELYAVRFETKFWQKAYASLPARARREHELHMRAAERWELRADAAIEVWSRAAAAFGRLFHMPSRSPSH